MRVWCQLVLDDPYHKQQTKTQPQINICGTKLYKYGTMQFIISKALFFGSAIILIIIVFCSKILVNDLMSNKEGCNYFGLCNFNQHLIYIIPLGLRKGTLNSVFAFVNVQENREESWSSQRSLSQDDAALKESLQIILLWKS